MKSFLIYYGPGSELDKVKLVMEDEFVLFLNSL